MKDPLKELGAIARERDAERERFEADPANNPAIGDADRAKIVAAAVALRSSQKKAARPMVWALGGMLAAAAAILLAVLIPRPGNDGAVPSYSIEVPSLGYSSLRGEPEPGKLLTLKKGMELEVLLRPETPAQRPLDSAVYLQQGEKSERLEWSSDLAPTGALRFRGELGRELKLPLGKSRLRFFIGDLSEGTPVPSDKVRLLELNVEVVD